VSGRRKTYGKNKIGGYQKNRHTGPEPKICHAPLRSIYFGFNGLSIPCCFNRNYVYGTLPAQSVDEIIKSPLRAELQEKLKKEDFSYGCEHCLNMINTENFESVEARLYDGLNRQKKDFPSEMIFELDNTCNLECVMCEGRFSSSILKNRDGTDYKQGPYDATFVEQLTPYLKRLEVAKFLGGEPFLIKQYYDIWEIILKVNPKCIINLQTNGTVYNQKIESLLKRGRFQIGISLDSLDKNLFESIRRPAVFETVISNIEKFHKHTLKKNCFINISTCPMIQNYKEVPQIVNYCNSKEFFIYFNTVYTNHFNLQELNSAELKAIVNYYKTSLLKGRGYIAKRNKNTFLSLTRQIANWQLQKLIEEERLVRRYTYSIEGFFTLIQQKTGRRDHFLDEKINRNLTGLPQEIKLSDAHLEHLQQISSEEFVRVLNQQPDIVLQKLMKNFLDTGNFLFNEKQNDV
jgi:MoaA/NifB/PqqE/SkfB family radical SAM enzyme